MGTALLGSRAGSEAVVCGVADMPMGSRFPKFFPPPAVVLYLCLSCMWAGARDDAVLAIFTCRGVIVVAASPPAYSRFFRVGGQNLNFYMHSYCHVSVGGGDR